MSVAGIIEVAAAEVVTKSVRDVVRNARLSSAADPSGVTVSVEGKELRVDEGDVAILQKAVREADHLAIYRWPLWRHFSQEGYIPPLASFLSVVILIVLTGLVGLVPLVAVLKTVGSLRLVVSSTHLLALPPNLWDLMDGVLAAVLAVIAIVLSLRWFWASLLRREERTQATLVTPTALIFDPDGVFKTARARIDLVFKLRLALAVLLAMLLTAGLAVLLVGVVRGTPNLAAAGGGTSVLDLIAVAVFKPFDRIRETIDDTQQLDLVHVMCKQRLSECQGHKVLRIRIECQKEVWHTVMGHVDIRVARPSSR